MSGFLFAGVGGAMIVYDFSGSLVAAGVVIVVYGVVEMLIEELQR